MPGGRMRGDTARAGCRIQIYDRMQPSHYPRAGGCNKESFRCSFEKAISAPRNALTVLGADRPPGIADATALHLLGHGSSLTPHGKRSRFSLNADEAHRLANLLAIERLLRELLGETAPWLRRANRSSPFGGQKPIEFMVRNGQTGIDRTRHFLEREAFRKSV